MIKGLLYVSMTLVALIAAILWVVIVPIFATGEIARTILCLAGGLGCGYLLSRSYKAIHELNV